MKNSRLQYIQSVVQQIKHDQQNHKTNKTKEKKLNQSSRTSLTKHAVTESCSQLAILETPLQDQKFDSMMNNIKRILEKQKVLNSPKQQLKHLLTTNQQKQIYGSRRHMIEVRFKEFYNSRVNSPPIVKVEVSDSIPTINNSKSVRLKQYQTRLGLLKKPDQLELKIQDIASRYQTKQ